MQQSVLDSVCNLPRKTRLILFSFWYAQWETNECAQKQKTKASNVYCLLVGSGGDYLSKSLGHRENQLLPTLLRSVFNFAPRGNIWLPGLKLAPRVEVGPQGWSWPPWVKLAPFWWSWTLWGKVIPQGWRPFLPNSRKCSPLGVNEGVNLLPREQISPLRARGEVKNGPEWSRVSWRMRK
jgi:hypothetical protein